MGFGNSLHSIPEGLHGALANSRSRPKRCAKRVTWSQARIRGRPRHQSDQLRRARRAVRTMLGVSKHAAQRKYASKASS